MARKVKTHTKFYGRSIAANDGYTPALEGKEKKAGGKFASHTRQTHGDDKGGKMVGYAEKKHQGIKGDTYHAEQKEHWGNRVNFKSDIKGSEKKYHGPMANIQHDDRGTKLISKGEVTHAKQPHRGDDTGAGSNTVARHHQGHTMRGKHGESHGIFRPSQATNAFRFHGTQNCGALRVSGHSGAHQIGKCKR